MGGLRSSRAPFPGQRNVACAGLPIVRLETVYRTLARYQWKMAFPRLPRLASRPPQRSAAAWIRVRPRGCAGMGFGVAGGAGVNGDAGACRHPLDPARVAWARAAGPGPAGRRFEYGLRAA